MTDKIEITAGFLVSFWQVCHEPNAILSE